MNELNKISIKTIKGIGEETATLLEEMKIQSVQDLLEHFPYRYEDYELKDLADAKHDEKVTVEGKVHSVPSLTYYGKKRSRLTFRLLVGRYLVTVTCFNRPYYKSKLEIDQTVTVTGNGISTAKRLLFKNYSFHLSKKIKPLSRFIPQKQRLL